MLKPLGNWHLSEKSSQATPPVTDCFFVTLKFSCKHYLAAMICMQATLWLKRGRL